MLLTFLLYFCAVGVAEKTIFAYRKRYSAPISDQSYLWYQLHFGGNILICILTFTNTMKVLFSMENDITYDNSLHSPLLCIAMHLYHFLFYNIRGIDVTHHVLMCGILAVSLFMQIGRYIDYTLFFICGLPGAIDYLMLMRVKEGRMKKIEEKRINTYLNAYIRGPFIIFGMGMYWDECARSDSIEHFNLLYTIVVGALMFWNAQYFTREVCVNYGYEKRVAEKRIRTECL